MLSNNRLSDSNSPKLNILRAAVAALCMVSMLFIFNYQSQTVYAASGYEFVILGTYGETMGVGDSFYLPYITTTGKKPSFSSSNSKVASVNTYGKITAKKAGTATITAKIKNGEASCKITVSKTRIELSEKSLTLENGNSKRLTACVSTKHAVTWKSSKKSIAQVNANGEVTAKKPGKTVITASVDGSSVSCSVTVKSPKITLSKTRLSLFRKGQAKLSISSTSKSDPVWKSNKKSVAIVDSTGMVTAVKNGTAIITVTVDGVSKMCEVTVKKPDITFEKTSLSLKKGEQKRLTVTVSSQNKPAYSSSNTNVASVDEFGRVTAKSAGRAYIYATEDGTKARMTVFVREAE